MGYAVAIEGGDLIRIAAGEEPLGHALTSFLDLGRSTQAFIVLADMRGVGGRPDEFEQALLLRWLEENQEELDSKCLAWAVVARDAQDIGVIKAHQWMAPTKFPVKVFDNRTTALEFLARHRLH